MSERRLAEALAKRAEEMTNAQSCDASKVTDSDRATEVRRNVRGDDSFLPGRKAAANEGGGLDRASLHAQKLYGAQKTGSCSSAITAQVRGCSGDELRQLFAPQ